MLDLFDDDNNRSVNFIYAVYVLFGVYKVLDSILLNNRFDF